MPKATKDVLKEEKIDENLSSTTTKKVEKTTKKTSVSKTNKQEVSKKSAKSTSSKPTVKSIKDTSTKNQTTSTSTKKTSSSRTKKTPTKKESFFAEYYDLPYRYNQTVVKVLAQTPQMLFVYWDISDEDRNSLINLHGENFFSETRPVLVVHNITHNYTFEIEINDFANSWYIRTGEPNSDYIIELGRRSNINNNEYIYINSSNEMASPNDHILFENIDLGNVLFKNVKTSKHAFKDFGDLKFINDIDKLYGNIYDVYSALYDDELLNELTNPSSGEFYLKK